MVQKLFEAKAFIFVMLGICVVGIGIKFLIFFTYKKLIKASDDMGNSQNKLMKILRLKFETCYKLKIGVNNVDAFVDRYVYKYRVAGVLLSTWENISGQALISCLLIGTVGAVLGIAWECGQFEVLSTVFFGAFTSGALIAVENLMNLHTKRTLLRIDIKDYLENYLKARLENEHFNPELMEQYRSEYFERKKEEKPVNTLEREEDVKELLESIEAMAAERVNEELKKRTKKPASFELSKSDEKIIEEILKEYMV